MSRKKVAIGIDLGTTKCCVGVVRDGKVEILENERGNKTTPSYVAFTNIERLVGEDAKDQATLNTANTVFGVKGIIGRGLEDDQMKKISTNMPYTIVDNAGDPCINVTYKAEKELLLPQQVIAMLLTKMKALAQTRLGCSIKDAVISVPASFGNAQRQATKDAATIAGLKVLALINEPTAAAIAYQANRKEEDKETIAVVDFGGGKLDIAIVSVSSSCVVVKGMSGTMDLGGNAVDEFLKMYLLDIFREKFSRDPPKGVSVLERLRAACVKLKHRLSLLPKIQDQLDCFGDEFLLPISISRRKYDEMISSKISSCMSTHFTRALHVSGSNKQNISRVVLVGGSTRIPLVTEEVQSFFNGTKLDRSVNPDEAVAHGAAIYAALLNGENTVTELSVNDILSNTFSMGAENSECVQQVFLESHIPSLREHRFSKKEMEQKQAFYEVLAGQKGPHKFLGTLFLSQEFARAVSLVDKVCFEINNCGVFDVHVLLKPNHIFHDVLHNYMARLSEIELQDAVERENRFMKDDKDEEDRIAALTNLESQCFDLQSTMRTSKGKTCFPELVEKIVQQALETIDWLDTTSTVTRSECLRKTKYLTKLECNLQDNINEVEILERKRAASENNLRLYCLRLEEVVKDDNAREEVELVVEIGELVKQNKEWLQTNEIPSTADCDARTAVLEKIHLELKTKVRERQQERARLAAIEELRCHCAVLQNELTTKQRSEQDMTLVNKLIDKTIAIVKWLFSDSGQSKADCDAKKMALEKMLLEIQKHDREAEEKERMRVATVETLQTNCHNILAMVDKCRVMRSDAPPAAQLVTEVRATLTWLQEGKTASLKQCEEKENIIQSLLTTFDEAVRNEEEQITTQRREDERKTALTNFQAERSHVESSLLTEALKEQHSDLVDDMVRIGHEITEWLETTKTFSRLEFESRVKPLAMIRVALATLLDERKKQLLIDAQQDASSERPASPMDTEGDFLIARDNDERSGDHECSSEDKKDQNNRKYLEDAQEEKSGDGGGVENNEGFMKQQGAKGSGVDGNNHSGGNGDGGSVENNESSLEQEGTKGSGVDGKNSSGGNGDDGSVENNESSLEQEGTKGSGVDGKNNSGGNGDGGSVENNESSLEQEGSKGSGVDGKNNSGGNGDGGSVENNESSLEQEGTKGSGVDGKNSSGGNGDGGSVENNESSLEQEGTKGSGVDGKNNSGGNGDGGSVENNESSVEQEGTKGSGVDGKNNSGGYGDGGSVESNESSVEQEGR